MKLKIPNEYFKNSLNDAIQLTNKFAVDATSLNDCVIFEGDEDDLLEFLTMYHDVDLNAAKNDLSNFVMTDKINSISYTPELALQKLNDFVVAKGGFNDYDKIYEALNNAIHGIV